MKGKIALLGHEEELDISPEDLNAIEKFFSDVTPRFIKDKVGIWNDNAKVKRLINLVKITHKANEELKPYGVKIKPLPLKESQLFIESASLEENESLQNMWANLLANTSSGIINPEISYISLLKELTPEAAKVLNIFYIFMHDTQIEQLTDCRLHKDMIIENIAEQTKNPDIVIDNLLRLRLVKEPERMYSSLPIFPFRRFLPKQQGVLDLSPVTNDDNRKIYEYLREENRNSMEIKNMLELSPLGYSFVIACNKPIHKEKSMHA